MYKGYHESEYQYLMSLLLQKQVLIFDRNGNTDYKKVFEEFVSNKFTDQSSVRISPALKEILGEDFTKWYNSLDSSSEVTIKTKIENKSNLKIKK